MRVLDVTTSVLTSLGRLGNGHDVGKLGPRPEKRLVLYEFEGCPYCRKVREALTILDLSVDVRPCPKGGHRFREEVIRRGGKAQFPYLVDPNAGVEIYESDEIVRHLFDRYGDGRVPTMLYLGPLGDLNSSLSGIPRIGHGTRVRQSRAPAAPLELYSMESSPFCRLVRERLCELEIAYHLHNVGRGSPSREAFVKRSGKMMVPWLSDPNTGTEMFESGAIVDYLQDSYGSAPIRM